MNSSAPSNYLAAVRDQYEDYPYPLRNPEDERKHLYITLHDVLEMLNYYGFGGRQNFRTGFRALVAGGGTGDAIIILAEQLRDTDAQLVYVDISRQSMKIAQERAAVRGLKNIEWHHGSLLDVAGMKLGKFDYINCCGVLHHLADPNAGLRALDAVLKDDGVIGIMVYGAIGRTGVYHMQALLKTMTRHLTNKQEKIELAKKVLANLPKTNLFALSYDTFAKGLSDMPNEEIYDLFFHSQDRAYTVGQIYDWLAECQLTLLDFVFANGLGKIVYKPWAYFRGLGFEKSFEGLSPRQSQETAELIVGNLIMHCFYVAKRPVAKPLPQDPDMVPFIIHHFHSSHALAYQHLRDAFAGTLDHAKVTQPGTNNSMVVPKGYFTVDIVQALDGTKTTAEIIEQVWQKHAGGPVTVTREMVIQEWLSLFEYLNYFDWILLRHKSVPAFAHLNDLQRKVAASAKA